MTNPAPDAAKLLPCPNVLCGSTDVDVITDLVGGLSYGVCGDCLCEGPAKKTIAEAITAWNTRPQTAPPKCEPDFKRLHTDALTAWWKCSNDDPFWCQRELFLVRYGYRLGLAARPKVEDAEVAEQIRLARQWPCDCEGALINKLADLLERLSADLRTKETQLAQADVVIKRREHQNELSRKYWLRAAKAALAGDVRELRTRVELYEAGPVEIIQSDQPRQRAAKEGDKSNG